MTRKDKYRLTKKRNTERRTRYALRAIRKYRFKTIEDARKELLGFVKVGEGAFRQAYRIQGTTLLMKFPVMDSYGDGEGGWQDDHLGKCHTRAEVRKIRALSKFRSLKHHVPPVYYFNSADGVMVTRYYPAVREWVINSNKNFVLSNVIKELTGVTLEDISGDNVKVDTRRSKLIFVDLGY
jgi:hypothetical protein